MKYRREKKGYLLQAEAIWLKFISTTQIGWPSEKFFLDKYENSSIVYEVYKP